MAEIAACGGFSSLDSADLEGIADYIGQLSELDPGSFSFRYWYDKDGKRSLSEALTHINLRNFANLMERLSLSISVVEDVAGLIRDYRAEMRAEMAQYMDYA
jgi:hypothetical protein